MFHSSDIVRGKTLRKNMPFAERLLWSRIRDQKLDFKFRRQYQIGKYYADFACVEKRLVIELDGDQHGRERDLRYDSARTDFIKANGWRVIRIPNGDIYKNLDAVENAIKMILEGKIDANEWFIEKWNG